MNSMGNNNNNIQSTASGAGVDPATLDQINRNMSDLRSGFERLSMQQQVLLASSSATTAAALVASSFQQQQHQQQQQQQEPFPSANSLSQTQGLSTSISNISTTRATWSDRPILRELSVQRNPDVVTNGCNEAVQTILDEGDTDNVIISSDPSHGDDSHEHEEEGPVFVSVSDASKSSTVPSNPSPVETSQKQVKSPLITGQTPKPEGKLFFIGFEEPDPESHIRAYGELPSEVMATRVGRRGFLLSPYSYNFIIDVVMELNVTGFSDLGIELSPENSLVNLEYADDSVLSGELM
ncbi:unnamed protein product [Trichobilharzia regenti]|nr:unnamed protein product [Trichobilharzia regenti]